MVICRTAQDLRRGARSRPPGARAAALLVLLALGGALAGGPLAGADHPGGDAAYPWADTARPYGIATRTPMATSRVAGSPGPLLSPIRSLALPTW